MSPLSPSHAYPTPPEGSAKRLWRLVRCIVGWFLIIVGIPITLLPTPFGLVLVMLGIALVGKQSRTLRHASVVFKRLLRRWAALDIPLIGSAGRLALQVQQDISRQLRQFPEDW